MTTSCVPASLNENAIRTMNVRGTGTVELEPDIAQALEDNNASANAIIQSLIVVGIEQNDIQTRNFNIYPQQDYRPIPEGEVQESQTTFVVENTIAVTVREIGPLGEVLVKVVMEGANTIHGVAFDVEDREAADIEARQLAIEDAQNQAQAIADSAGVTLGAIYSISIDQNGSMPVERAIVMEEDQDASVPISGGTLTIQITANLTFEIE